MFLGPSITTPTPFYPYIYERQLPPTEEVTALFTNR